MSGRWTDIIILHCTDNGYPTIICFLMTNTTNCNVIFLGAICKCA